MFDARGGYYVPGASAEAIAALEAVVPAAIPDSYLAFLSFSNGWEGPIPVEPRWICLFPAEELTMLQQVIRAEDVFPGRFVIGRSSDGRALAFDVAESEECPVVAFDPVHPTAIGPVARLADSFHELTKLFGRTA